jgi:hypothetical protein
MAIIKGLSDSDYNALPEVRSSVLSTIDRKTLAHAKWSLDNVNSGGTDAMIVGSAFHDMILRPGLFKELWGVLPEGFTARSNDSKALKAELEAKYNGRVLKADQHNELLTWGKAAEQDPVLKSLLPFITDTELTLTWQEGTIPCKARIDAVAKIKDQTLLIDIKTAKSAAPYAFMQSCVGYGYIIQSCHYLAGARANGLIPEESTKFIHVVLEKEPPYLVATYTLDDATLELGEKRRQEALRKYGLAKGSDIWPGYSQQIETVSAPHFCFQTEGETNE